VAGAATAMLLARAGLHVHIGGLLASLLVAALDDDPTETRRGRRRGPPMSPGRATDLARLLAGRGIPVTAREEVYD
jgi:hypothetical protein